jgi:hypothetical protein
MNAVQEKQKYLVSAPGAVNSPKILKIYQQAGSDTIEAKITANEISLSTIDSAGR